MKAQYQATKQRRQRNREVVNVLKATAEARDIFAQATEGMSEQSQIHLEARLKTVHEFADEKKPSNGLMASEYIDYETLFELAVTSLVRSALLKELHIRLRQNRKPFERHR